MATNEEILKAAAKNASYILKLEVEIEGLQAEIDAYRKLLKAIHSLGNLDEQWNKKIREYLAKGE